MMNIPRIVISALKGSSSKTLVSLCIIAALRNKGLRVAPFKKGPDFIDPQWLAAAAEFPCHNLDVFLMGKEKVVESFITHSCENDIAVIEGNRGLFDGVDSLGSYSTAELSKLLHAPLILSVDCTKMTNTASALIQGCTSYDKEVRISGIILSYIAGARHERVIRKSIARHCGIPVVGAIPKLPSPPISERHLGLFAEKECVDSQTVLDRMHDLAVRHLDLDQIVSISNKAGELKPPDSLNDRPALEASFGESVTIGVIEDQAFHFYYPENLTALKKSGGELVSINSLRDAHLPRIDLLYIGGGFPELYIKEISKNRSLLDDIKSHAEDGLPIYAECGGAILLGDSLIKDGESHKLAGVLPITYSLEKKPQGHGYSVVKVKEENPFFPKDLLIKGHEFHYSRVLDWRKDALRFAFMVEKGTGFGDKQDGICYKNVLASYIHIHAACLPEWREGLLRMARERKVMYPSVLMPPLSDIYEPIAQR